MRVARTSLPLFVLGVAMVGAAVLPAVDAHDRAAAATPAPSASPRQPVQVHHRPARHPSAAPSHRPTSARAKHHPMHRRAAATSAPAPQPSPTQARPATRSSTRGGATAGATTRATHPAKAAPHVSGPTGWAALNAAIARIPTYRAGMAHWVISSKYGHWGTADWYHATLYIAPDVPTDMLFNVAVHEWSHELSVLDYNGNVPAATAAMNRAFGGSGLVGAERAADCMSRLQGATWTHYTSCTDRRWRAAAARLVAGKQL